VRRPRRSKIVLNITSMIDVIFILLLFFLVTSSFTDQPGLAIDLPSAAGTGSAGDGALTLTVSSSGEFYLNRQPVLRADLPRALAAEAARGPDRALVLKADRAIPYGLAVEIMDLSRTAGLRKIVALTTPQNQEASE